jgi:hypothetical protein
MSLLEVTEDLVLFRLLDTPRGASAWEGAKSAALTEQSFARRAARGSAVARVTGLGLNHPAANEREENTEGQS